MSALLAGAVGAAASTMAALGGARLSILIFHRVLPAPDPLFPAEMHARQFEACMRAVVKAFRVLSLREAVALLKANRLPSKAMVVTFDDGYADNHDVALPIMRAVGVQGTFFVSTGFLNGGRMFNDTVIECFRSTRLSEVDLSFLGLPVLPLREVEQKQAAIRQTLPAIKYKPLEQRPQALEALHSALGQPRLPDNLMMTDAQVGALHKAGMEIGAHTVDHPILTQTPDDQARWQMAQGRSRLEAITGHAVGSFAYPNGVPGRDFDARHVAMARELGFEAAVTTAPGVSRYGADLHQLPRFTPWDRNPSKWLVRLAHNQLRTQFQAVQA